MKSEDDIDFVLVKKAKVISKSKIIEQDVLFNYKIIKVGKNLQDDANIIIDATDYYLMYGFIDPHVHLRNFSESYKEDFESGTKAAVHGGATTVIDMPNNKPFVDDQNKLDRKIELAKNSKLYCNLHFYLGISKNNIDNFFQVKNCIGYKLYASQTTNVEENLSFEELKKILVNYDKDKTQRPLYVHAEKVTNHVTKNLEEHEKSRSEFDELELVKHLCDINKKIHITHVSSPFTADFLVKNRVSFDLTPHHCMFYLDENIVLSEKAQNLLKVNPPIRKIESQKFLTGYLKTSYCLLGSDHAPHSMDEKSDEFSKCPSGISSLDVILPLWLHIFTNIEEKHSGMRLLAEKNLKMYRKFRIKNKGEIKKDNVADLVIFEEKEVRIDTSNWFSKAKKSPYNGFLLGYKVVTTIVNGKLRYHNGKVHE
ncbi:MAG: dihydroorotase family protein [Candidatus Micrarchaeota archaeon]|nr:dihydroorotase family protein [Candidatus Micrarchaeota archaeon]